MTAATVAVGERQRPDRGWRYFWKEQTVVSGVALILGAGALLLLFVGSIIVLTYYGWTPWESLAIGLTSSQLLAVAAITIALGVAGAVVGWGTYRGMPTRSSKEACISGAVLGVQAFVLAVVYLWFRAGDVATVVRNFLDFDLFVDIWPRFIRGALNTLILSFGGISLGIVIGLILSVFIMSNRPVVRAPARVYINFFRGTPLLWQLSFAGLGVVAALRLDLSPYAVAIIVLGLNSGAYTAEIFRAGIQSLERGQMEAARSTGMSYLQAVRLVILPQAFRRVIPPLTNEFVILIKDTSLVIVLGLTVFQQELMGTARNLYSSSFNATAWIGAAVGYLAITLPLIRLVTVLEKRLRSGLTSVIG